jgi:hypothetical protein
VRITSTPSLSPRVAPSIEPPAQSTTSTERAYGPPLDGQQRLQSWSGWGGSKAHHAPALTGGARKRREVIALALAGVTVFNAFAPIWGPALGNAADPATRLLDAGLRSELLQLAKSSSPLDVLSAQLSATPERAPAILDHADRALLAVDDALQLPAGTAKELAVQRALVDAGVEPVAAQAAARLVSHAEGAASGVRHLREAAAAGRLDIDAVGHDVSAILDKILSDPHVTLCFVAGFALVPAPAQHGTNAVVKVGKALVDAKLRHDHAIAALKATRSGNAAVDVVARLAGEAVDAVSFAAMFLGPGPLLNAARGTDLLLVASELVAAKTAMKATTKSLTAYSALPEDIAALALGAVAAAELRNAAGALGVEGQVAVEQAASLAGGVRDAVAARDGHRAFEAVQAAWQDMTPHEREALQTLLRQGAERVVLNAGS